jgi:hypothetical protein
MHRSFLYANPENEVVCNDSTRGSLPLDECFKSVVLVCMLQRKEQGKQKINANVFRAGGMALGEKRVSGNRSTCVIPVISIEDSVHVSSKVADVTEMVVPLV